MKNNIETRLSSNRKKSLNYHMMNNKDLYNEYLNSKFQYTMTFLEFKSKRKRNRKLLLDN